MSTLIDLFWIASDLIVAAANGLHLLPLALIAFLIGLVQARKGHYLLKSLLATGLGLIANAVMPLTQGLTPVLPDLLAIETQIQAAVMLAVAFVIIRVMCVVKNTISLTPRRKIKV